MLNQKEAMKKILIFGAGKIGVTLAHLLSEAGDYAIILVDDHLESAQKHFGKNVPNHIEFKSLDVNDEKGLQALVKSACPLAVVSSLPYFCNPIIAELAKKHLLHYFDLTEDIVTVQLIDQLAKQDKNSYVPQCGVAPGLINIMASDLIKNFDQVEDVKLRCGALPISSSNALGYVLTWSVEGLINEYGNPCQAIVNHHIKEVAPLSDLEEILIDGAKYEAFNTSGGAGSLVSTYHKKVKNLNYKSIRYPGHCEKMRFLMKGLKLNEHRDTLKTILLNAIPYSPDDVVIVYVAVNGYRDSKLFRETHIKKFHPQKKEKIIYSAIQMVTATAAAVVIDMVLTHPEQYHGRIKQEDFCLETIFQNRLAAYLREAS